MCIRDRVTGNFCEIYGLEIVNFPDDGIDVTFGDFCIVGAPNKGNVIYNNGSPIDFFPGAPGTGPWDGCGIVMKNGASNTIVQGNIVGTNYTQTINGGNEYCGIIVQDNCTQNLIGGSGPGEANIIAFNEAGVRISNTSFGCRITQNYMYCNSIVGIQLLGTGNQFQAAPTIINASTTAITGVAAPNDFIEVFANNDSLCVGAPCQGGPFLGIVQADASGAWTLSAPFANSLANVNNVVATATDNNNNTSTFSTCFSLSNCSSFPSSAFAANASCGLNNGAVISQPNGGTAPYLSLIHISEPTRPY